MNVHGRNGGWMRSCRSRGCKAERLAGCWRAGMRRAYQVGVVGAAIGVLSFSLWRAGRSSGGVSWRLPIIDVATGNRLTNASAYYLGYKGYPVVSNFGFL